MREYNFKDKLKMGEKSVIFLYLPAKVTVLYEQKYCQFQFP